MTERGLLERDQAVQVLEAQLATCRQGEGSVVLIAGEAGIGKSTLVDVFLRGHAVRVLRGNCDPLSTPRPLGPFLDMAVDLGGRVSSSIRQSDSGHLVLDEILTELRNGPVTAMVIEDVHWADQATLDVVSFLTSRIEHLPVVLLITARVEDIAHNASVRTTIGHLMRVKTVTRIDLAPLSLSAIGLLCEGSSLDPNALYERTGGNPFFVIESLAGQSDSLPSRIADAVMARVLRLSPSGVAALEAASALGGRFPSEAVTFVAECDERAVDECLVHRLLVADAGGALAFPHDLTRACVHSSIGPVRRRHLHARCLTWLKSAHSVEAAELAHHAEEAGSAEEVRIYSLLAAHRAADLKAHRQSADHYRRALNFSSGAEDASRAQLLERLSHEAYMARDLREAIEARREAVDVWIGMNRKAEQVEGLVSLSRLLEFVSEIDEAVAVSKRAMELSVEAGDPAVSARALSNRAHLAEKLGAVDAPDWAQRAVISARAHGDLETYVHSLITLGTARMTNGDSAGAMDVIEGAELALANGMEENTMRAYVNLASRAIQEFDPDRATRYLLAGEQFCRTHNLALGADSIAAFSTWVAAVRGHWSLVDEASIDTMWDELLLAGAIVTLAKSLVAVRRGSVDALEVIDRGMSSRVTTSRNDSFWFLLARVEYEFLQGKSGQAAMILAMAVAVAPNRSDPWIETQLAFWSWMLGDRLPEPNSGADPFSIQRAGDWERAAADWGVRGCLYHRAFALLDATDLPNLSTALEIFEEMGARPGADMARRRMRQLGLRAARSRLKSRHTTTPFGLSKRELEIFDLLATNLTNKQIADRLFLSPKTVEHHVSRIIAKVGASDRHDAVRKASPSSMPEKIGVPAAQK